MVFSSTCLPSLPEKIAHHPREAAEDQRDRHHADGHHRFLQVAGVALKLGKAVDQALEAVSWICVAAGSEHGLGDDQFAHQVDHLIDLLHLHADRRVPPTQAAGAALAARARGSAGGWTAVVATAGATGETAVGYYDGFRNRRQGFEEAKSVTLFGHNRSRRWRKTGSKKP